MLLIFAAYLPTADFAAHVDPWRRSARSPFGCSCRRSRPVGRRSSWQISVRVLGLICCATACCGALRRSPGDGSQPVPEHPQPGHPDCPARPSGRWLPQSGRCIGVPIRAGFGPGLSPGGYSRWCPTSVRADLAAGRPRRVFRRAIGVCRVLLGRGYAGGGGQWMAPSGPASAPVCVQADIAVGA